MNLAPQLAQLETARLIRHLAEDEPAFVFKHAHTPCDSRALFLNLPDVRAVLENHVAR